LISLGGAVLPAVPNDAVVNFQGQDYIFVLAKKGEKKDEQSIGQEIYFERVPVVKGTSDVGYTEVTLLKNLPPKTQIIAKGAFFALAKMTNTGEEEH
jgi:hypothetical protein